jgi:hypothetical protein
MGCDIVVTQVLGHFEHSALIFRLMQSETNDCFLDYFTLKVKALQFYETAGTISTNGTVPHEITTQPTTVPHSR